MYRAGGSSHYNTKFRDIGCSLCMVISLIILFGVHGWKEYLAYLASIGLMWGALSSYRYWLKKPDNYTWAYYALHGFLVALAIAPWAFASGHLIGMAARCVVCAGLVGLWSGLMKWPTGEEFGRGIIMCASLLLLLLF